MELLYPDINIADIASKTEGYVFHDIKSLVDRAIHFAVMARMQQTSCNYLLLLVLSKMNDALALQLMLSIL